MFPLGAADAYVAIGSFNNFNPKMQNGTTFQNNEYWVGTISDSNKFEPTSRGVLDFGMYCESAAALFSASQKESQRSFLCTDAARTGSTAAVEEPSTARRVIFGATGWAPPRGLPGCQPHTSMQVIPP